MIFFVNFLNSKCSIAKLPKNLQSLGVAVGLNTIAPTYAFDGNLTETFSLDESLQSRWQAQISLNVFWVYDNVKLKVTIINHQ